MVNRRTWLVGVLIFVTAIVYGQIDSSTAGCAILDAAISADGEEGVVVISLDLWSTEVEPWSYEVETSSGAIFVVSSDATRIEQVRGAQSGSRKQLERNATARAIRTGEIPGLCDLFREHYAAAPGSIVLEAEIEYEQGEYEADLEYRPQADSRVVREREWEW